MLWKIYFWIYLTLTITALLASLPNLAKLTFANWEGVAEGMAILIAAYSYIFNKVVFSQKVWRMVLYYFVAVWILGLIYSLGGDLGPLNFLFQASGQVTWGIAIFSIILAAPGLYAVYRLSGVKYKARKK